MIDQPEGTDAAAPSLGDLEGRAVRASLLTAIQAIVGLPLAFAANLIVARWLDPHGYGVLASYMAGFGILLVILNGGISDGSIQWGAAAYARGDRGALRDIARRCSGYHLLVEGPLGAAAAVFFLRHEAVWVQVGAAAAVGVTMALGTAVVMMTAMSRTSVLAKQALLINVALQVGVVLAAVQTHGAGPVWAVRLLVGSTTTLWPILLLPRDIRSAVLRPALPMRWPTGFARYSFGSLVAGVVTAMVFSRSEVLILGAYGWPAAAGLYALAAGLASQLTAPVDAMLGPLVPATAGLVAVDPEQVPRALVRGVRVSTLALLPLLMLGVPTVALVVRLLYGSAYASAAAPFVALAVVSCAQSALHPVTAFVGAMRRPMLVLAVNGAALVLDLAIVIAAARWSALWAAVIANAVGQVVSLLALSVVVSRAYRVSLAAIGAALIPMVLISFWSAAVALVALCVPGVLPLRFAVVVVLGPLVGWAVLRGIGGVITTGDLNALTRSLPRRLALIVRASARLGLVSQEREAT